MYVCVLSHLSCVQLFVTLWTTAFQAPLSIGFFSQEYWSGSPRPPPGDPPDPRIEHMCPVQPALWADSSPLSHQGSPRQCYIRHQKQDLIKIVK